MIADGKVIAQRKKGLMSSLFGGGWPDPTEVVNALHKRAS